MTPDQTDTSWEDATTAITTGSDDPVAASWYLTRNRLWPWLNDIKWGPIKLGVILFLIVVMCILFSPSTESHFIYTDF